jgi:hypothetical protein
VRVRNDRVPGTLDRLLTKNSSPFLIYNMHPDQS